MKMSQIKKILYIILVLDCVAAAQKGISESKCDEYEAASLYTDPSSQNPFLMTIFTKWTGTEFFFIQSVGTLISEQYMLAIKQYSNWFNNVDNLIVRKGEVDRKDFIGNKTFGVERVIFSPEGLSIRFALFQLNETISYRDHMSIFRPICLWTATTIGSSLNYSLCSEYIGELRIQPEQITEDVSYYDEKVNISTTALMSLFSTMALVKHQNRNYVLGALFRHNYLGNSMTLLCHYISWIESIVWPDQFECGQRKITHKSHITFGFPTYHGQFPWHVALYQMDGGRQNSQKYICGGTIINNQTIITAAHCIHQDYGVLPANRLLIVAGIHDLTKYTIDTQTFTVQNITVHPNYDREYLEHDIAIVKLFTPIKFTNYIQPICLGNTSDYINMTTGTVAGWGYDEYNQPTNVLIAATMPLQTYNDCRRSNRDFFHTFLNNYNFCAGDGLGTSTCSGDSGGAIIFERNSAFYIRGIVSLGVALTNTGQCDMSQYVLFTDVPKFYEWIVKTIDEN